MGYIKEPAGIDFIVDPKPLTPEDRKRMSAIIAHYKATGKKKIISTSSKEGSSKVRSKKSTA
jgi:hypothetical protein